jgi:hypothetical protein
VVQDASSLADVGGICVTAYSSNGGGIVAWPAASTNGNGQYTISNIPAGNYAVEFSDGCGDTSDYLTQWYNNASSPATATLVATGTTADDDMVRAGQISGSVIVATSHVAVPNACVNAYLGSSQTPSGLTGISGLDGTYTISDLAAGSYTVAADPTCAGQQSSSYAYLSDPNPVSVSAGATTEPINFALPSGTGAAPVPAATDGVTFSSPTTAVTASGVPTPVASSELGSSASLVVPAGALPAGTSVSVYPVNNAAVAAQDLSTTSTTAYVAGFAVSWLTTSDTSPTATSPITMTINDPNIAAGDAVYVLTPDGPQLVGTAIAAGSVTITLTQDPVILVGAPPQYLRLAQTITFGSLSNAILGSSARSLSATATSGLTVAFSSITPRVCTETGGSVSFIATGMCTITATQAGNSIWQPAPLASQSLSVEYGFGGFREPRNNSTISKTKSSIAVEFKLTGVSGTPISSRTATSLARARSVEAVLSGPAITADKATCTWRSPYFRCTIRIASYVKRTVGVAYTIAALEREGGLFVDALPTGTAVNPETIKFR